MLFVDDGDPQIAEPHSLLDERMGSYHHLDLPAGYGRLDLASLAGGLAALQQSHSGSESAQFRAESRHVLIGQHLGYSGSHQITQERVDLFSEATGDHQWIHVDPERAKDGPFGTAIAHGYLTLSLVPVYLHEVLVVEGTSMGINYGCNKVRFPSPVPVDSTLRLGVTVAGAEDVKGGVQVALDVTLETEGSTKPSCVAEVVYRYYS